MVQFDCYTTNTKKATIRNNIEVAAHRVSLHFCYHIHNIFQFLLFQKWASYTLDPAPSKSAPEVEIGNFNSVELTTNYSAK